jgi:hypothetical protein
MDARVKPAHDERWIASSQALLAMTTARSFALPRELPPAAAAFFRDHAFLDRALRAVLPCIHV